MDTHEKAQVLNKANFRAAAGDVQGFGRSPREALDALMARLPQAGTPPPIVILPFNQGDAFFSDAQQARLRELKARRDSLTPEEWAELEGLVEASLDATIERTRSLPHLKP